MLTAIEGLVDAGRTDEAGAALAALDAGETRDAALHLALARLAERIGDLGRAVLEYNLALRDDPAAVEALRRLARLRIDQGEARRAERALRRLLEVAPGDAEAVVELGELLASEGRPDEARALFASLPGEARVAAAAARLDAAADDEAPPPDEAPAEHDAVLFAELFAGREGVHARQWRSATGKHGYTPVHEPFTPHVARNHLAGNVTVGIYPVRQDGTVHFLAFDVDVARFARASDDGRALAAALKRAHTFACRLLDAAAALGLDACLEDSGWKGRHVWLFFAEPTPATGARRLAEKLLRGAGALPEGVQVEVFPKQSRVAAGALGNLIKLPLGVHRVTGRRCVLLDAGGRPVPRPFDVLRTIGRIPRAALRDLLADAPPLEFDGGAPAIADPWAEDDATDPDALAAPSAVMPAWRLEDDAEWQWVLRGCAVLREVARRAESGLLDRAEQNVVVYTAGHLTEGARVVNALLGRLFNVDRGMLLKSPLRGHPMSCPKIRARLPGVAAAVGCNCRFPADAGMYPHPLLHLQTLRARAGGPPASALQVERLVGDLGQARTEQRRLQSLVRELEGRLRGLLEELAVDHLETPVGTLRIEPDGGLVIESRERADGALRDGAGGGGGPGAGEAGDPQGEPPARLGPD